MPRHRRSIGAGEGYKYAHSFGGWADQQHLPDELADRRYFEAIDGREAELAERLEEDEERTRGVRLGSWSKHFSG